MSIPVKITDLRKTTHKHTLLSKDVLVGSFFEGTIGNIGPAVFYRGPYFIVCLTFPSRTWDCNQDDALIINNYILLDAELIIHGEAEE